MTLLGLRIGDQKLFSLLVDFFDGQIMFNKPVLTNIVQCLVTAYTCSSQCFFWSRVVFC